MNGERDECRADSCALLPQSYQSLRWVRFTFMTAPLVLNCFQTESDLAPTSTPLLLGCPQTVRSTATTDHLGIPGYLHSQKFRMLYSAFGLSVSC